MREIIEIPSFSIDSLSVRRCFAVKCGNACALVCPETGTTLCVDNELLEMITRHELSDDLTLLLVQRGFADYLNSRKLSCTYERIKPEFFLIDMTKHCNLRCKYCFREDVGDYCRISKDMVDRICRSLIDCWKNDSTLRMSIQPWGGEPLLEFPLLLRIRENFNKAGLDPEIVIETNATLITKEKAEALFRNNVKIGISIDGNDFVQNEQRPYVDGKPTYEDVKKGILYLRKAGYKSFGTITVVTRNTVENIEQIMQCFTDDLGLTSVKFNLMRKNSKNADFSIFLEEIPDYVDKLLCEMKKLYNKGISLVEQNLSQRMVNLLHRPNNNICSSCGCHGGYRMVSISTEGKVYPCELTDYSEFCMGTIDNYDFAKTVENAINSQNPYFAERELKKCNDCPWKYYCRGGCRSAVKYLKGTTTLIDETECAFNNAVYPRLVDIILNEPKFAYYLIDGRI